MRDGRSGTGCYLAARTIKDGGPHAHEHFVWVAIVGPHHLGLFDVAWRDDTADRRRNQSSVAVNAVPSGTHFLVRLDDELSTGKHKVNKKFEAKTLEPLETSNGYSSVWREGPGHISRIEPAGLTGRAKNLAELRRY